AHRTSALLLLVRSPAELALDLSTEAFERGRRQHALRRAADAHHAVDAGARDCGVDAGGEVTVADELDPRAGGTNLRDELLVAWPIEDDDGDVPDLAPERLG